MLSATNNLIRDFNNMDRIMTPLRVCSTQCLIWPSSLILIGHASFEEASAILHKLKPTTNRASRFSKPTGMLGSIAYYGKELFYILFMNGPPEPEIISSQNAAKKLSKPLAQAVMLLEESVEQGNPDAMYTLAEMNFYGNYSHPRNYPQALKRYKELADLNGNSSAQHMIGFMYATGIGGATRQDQAKALLYHTFAAEAGNLKSQMTVAFRHHTGIGTPRNCEEAVLWYKKVADAAMKYVRSGPPGGHYMAKKSYRIADADGGVYGEGASVSSSGPNAKTGGPNSDAYAAFEDVLEYLELMHRKGDFKATFSLGQLYYDGSRELKHDFRTAKAYFYDVARVYWAKDGKVKTDGPPGIERLASKAAGYIGRMWLRGEGVTTNYELAQVWFKRGIANGDALCLYQMGLMHLYGLGVPKDAVKAAELFGPAADQDMAAAQVKLGALFLDQGDVQTASKYFDLAARNGHIEAYYYLADLAYQGIGRDSSCGVAVLYYKIVAEKAEKLLSPFAEANSAYEMGDLETALVDYMMAAEQGFEVGQANVAYILDQARPHSLFSRSIIPFSSRKASIPANDELALIYWTRSAKQMNIDSAVKMGDYYLEGFGTSLDKEKAAACYQAAAETMQCAQAMWNLGWMHENGIGLEQDFHLAKRYYDLALETNPNEAYLPVTLALYKLRLRSWWNDVTHGKVKSIQNEPGKSTSLCVTESFPSN